MGNGASSIGRTQYPIPVTAILVTAVFLGARQEKAAPSGQHTPVEGSAAPFWPPEEENPLVFCPVPNRFHVKDAQKKMLKRNQIILFLVSNLLQKRFPNWWQQINC